MMMNMMKMKKTHVNTVDNTKGTVNCLDPFDHERQDVYDNLLSLLICNPYFPQFETDSTQGQQSDIGGDGSRFYR